MSSGTWSVTCSCGGKGGVRLLGVGHKPLADRCTRGLLPCCGGRLGGLGGLNDRFQVGGQLLRGQGRCGLSGVGRCHDREFLLRVCRVLGALALLHDLVDGFGCPPEGRVGALVGVSFGEGRVGGVLGSHLQGFLEM